MVNYCYVKEELHNSEIGNYTAYAISAYEYSNHKKTKIYISDVFLDESDAKSFVKLCNEMELDPVHLPQVIEDALTLNQ